VPPSFDGPENSLALTLIPGGGKSTLAAIAAELEARGVRTPAGRSSWAPAQVSRLLAA